MGVRWAWGQGYPKRPGGGRGRRRREADAATWHLPHEQVPQGKGVLGDTSMARPGLRCLAEAEALWGGTRGGGSGQGAELRPGTRCEG